MRPRTILIPVLVAAACLGLTARPGASEAGRAFLVIVNPDNPISSIDRDFLRDAYLKKTAEWGDGTTIHPVDLSPQFPTRARFVHDVLRKTPAQLRTYWNQQIFSGKAVPPPQARSTASVIDYVRATPGAIGYLPPDVDPRGAKVVEVE
jgi:ABC-type phosphate transport system substrate-binding protein